MDIDAGEAVKRAAFVIKEAEAQGASAYTHQNAAYVQDAAYVAHFALQQYEGAGRMREIYLEKAERLKAAIAQIGTYSDGDVGSCRLALRILREHVPEAF